VKLHEYEQGIPVANCDGFLVTLSLVFTTGLVSVNIGLKSALSFSESLRCCSV
jgi:hypothetical protein